MCGFSAIADRTITNVQAREYTEAMLNAMAHRGPDARGIENYGPITLGHNRLSVIDLSEAANQPMVRDHLAIVFNGEVYNYVELRRELEGDGATFTTGSDTEVVLQAYRTWGSACVQRFIGMWAFAIWDSRQSVLFCSRDRFGIKPFHYAVNQGRLYIASEIKALRKTPLVSSTLNSDQIARGLYVGWMHHWNETYFADVQALPAGHNLLWKNNAVHIEQYSTILTGSLSPLSFAEHAEQFRELFIDSIRLTSRRDVPMGVCLSGGLDSTSIACALAAATNEHQIKTFTAYYTGTGDVDERPYIDHVLRTYPQIQPYYISPTDVQVAEAMERIVAMMDAPIPSSSYISQYFVMQLAAEHGVKVVLDGQGSDEIMGGYMHSMYRVIADLLRDGHPIRAVTEWQAHTKRQHYSLTKRASVLAKSVLTLLRDEHDLYSLEFRHTYPWVMNSHPSTISLRLENPHGSRLNTFLYNLMYVTLLPTLLHTEDLNSMAFSIESRVPFLDHRLVQFCFSLPNEHKVHKGETKRILRAAMRGLVPDAVLDRKDKTGFITPGHTKWLRGALSHRVHESWDVVYPYVNPTMLNTVIRAYQNGDDRHALFVWRLVMLKAFVQSL